MKQEIKIMVLGFMFILLWNNMNGQDIETPAQLNCPREEINVHLSQLCSFPGEILKFEIYCTSSLFPDVFISDLAFIELVSNDNTSLIRKKILLKKGIGSGEFEIPPSLSTGLYYILAYTNWMKNFGEESFFSQAVLIVNGYQPFNFNRDNQDSMKLITETANSDSHGRSDLLKLIPSSEKYSTREKVSVDILTGTLSGKKISGNFSVSVYRKEPPMILKKNKSEVGTAITIPDSIIYLPDHDGIRLSGLFTDNDGIPLSDSFIKLSLPGPGTDIKSSLTDKQGKFNFLLKPEIGEKDIVVTLPDADTKMTLEESYWNGFRSLNHDLEVVMDPDEINFLKEKFTYYQLQKRFKIDNFIKSTNVSSYADSSLFYSKPYQVIDMKTYITLDSLREYFYELVQSVKFIKRRGGIDIYFTDPLTMIPLTENPGIFIDGVLYDDYGIIGSIPVTDIDHMTIISSVYYFMNFSFGGIIDIHSKKSDFYGVKLLPGMVRFIYPMANLSEWEFKSPDYSESGSGERIPDFRYLLCWQPNVKIDKSGIASIQFYTGDLNGAYVIKVVGLSDDGEILKTETEIYVDNK